MTLREAVHAVHVMTYDQVCHVRSEDRMLRKVARWRLKEPVAWREIRDHVYGGPQASNHGGGRTPGYGKPTATIVEVRERALREAS